MTLNFSSSCGLGLQICMAISGLWGSAYGTQSFVHDQQAISQLSTSRICCANSFQHRSTYHTQVPPLCRRKIHSTVLPRWPPSQVACRNNSEQGVTFVTGIVWPQAEEREVSIQEGSGGLRNTDTAPQRRQDRHTEWVRPHPARSGKGNRGTA